MIKTSRMKELQICGCGCGRRAHWHQLHLLRGADNSSHFVLDECREAFADELAQRGKLRRLRAALAGTFFWQRWRAAQAWYVLQFAVRARLSGPDEAARVARRDTLLFVMPGWLARMFVRRSVKL
jgi:hypothetical protein